MEHLTSYCSKLRDPTSMKRPQLQIRGGIYIIFFLFLIKNILEVPRQDASNEYPQHVFDEK